MKYEIACSCGHRVVVSERQDADRIARLHNEMGHVVNIKVDY